MNSTPDRRRSNLLREAGQRGSIIVVDQRGKKKSWRFLLAFLALAVVAYASALDATSLSIALPVSQNTDGSLASHSDRRC